jgi:hypothetical protein
MRSSTLPALILFCLMALVWSATARAERIEVHRMGKGPPAGVPGQIGPGQIPHGVPRGLPGVALPHVPDVVPRRIPPVVPRRVRRWRIFEHVAIDEFDDLTPVEPEEIPDDPEPEEETETTEIESLEEIYDTLNVDNVGFGGPLSQGQVPEPATIVLVGVGLAALLLGRRRK